MNSTQKVMSVILAGGQGTRLFPLTMHRCKPAVAFGSRYRLIDVPISNSLHSGIRQIAVISQYFASELNQHIADTYRLDQFQQGKFTLLSPEETHSKKVWFQGTADAVRQNLEHLLSSGAEYFLILSGDQLYTIDFRAMLHFAIEKNADLVISALPVKEKEARRMGLLKIDSSAKVTDFFEKPTEPQILEKFQLPHSPVAPQKDPTYLGSMGIYIFKKSALISILQEPGDDFGRHIIPLQQKKGNTFSFVHTGYWEDIGTIASYYEANLALTQPSPLLDIYDDLRPIYGEPLHLPPTSFHKTVLEHSILAQGCLIKAHRIAHSIIGLKTTIGTGTTLHASIVIGGLSPTIIGKNCLIEKTIIDENTQIGDHVSLTNKQRFDNYDGNGIFVRDGIIIVTNGTHLPDGFTF